MAGKFSDNIAGMQRSGSQLQWPVCCWKSPSIPATAPGTFIVPSPIPPHAFVDYAMESLGTEAGYAKGDHVRLQRCAIVGANDYFHPAWIAASRTMALLSGNGSNAFYVGNKSTGAGTALTDGNWNQRLFGAWPMLRDGSLWQRLDKKGSLSFKNGSGIRILRKRVETPWVRGVAAAAQYLYDLKQFGHTDEPAFIQLWGKCIEPDMGYQTGQETPIKGLDATGSGEVFYNGSTVGWVHNSSGFAGVNAISGAVGTFTHTKWYFQLRIAFAGEPDDMPDLRTVRGRGNGLVGFWSSPWKLMPLSVGAGAQAPVFQLPENFNPIDMQVVIRARVASVPTALWAQGDQVYSMHPGYSGYAGWQNFIVEGRKVTLPWSDGLAYIFRSGAGAGTYLYVGGQTQAIEFQVRAIG